MRCLRSALLASLGVTGVNGVNGMYGEYGVARPVRGVPRAALDNGFRGRASRRVVFVGTLRVGAWLLVWRKGKGAVREDELAAACFRGEGEAGRAG